MEKSKNFAMSFLGFYVDGNNKQAVEFMSLEASSGERFDIGKVSLSWGVFGGNSLK